MTVTNERGEAVSGASVSLEVKYRQSGSWVTASPLLTGTTNASGQIVLTSASYGSSTSKLRFQVKSVTRSAMTWQTNTSRLDVSRP